MSQITNKIKLSRLFTVVLLASWMFVSCSQKTEGTDGAAADSTEQVMEQKMAPDSLSNDSLPELGDSSSTRPEPRKTK